MRPSTARAIREAPARAREELLAELAELRLVGHACNVQNWTHGGFKKKNVAECAARRREARRLLRIAIEAVRSAR